MSGIFVGTGIALTALVLYVLLDAMGYRGARLLTLTATVMIYALAVSLIPELLSSIELISERTGIGETVRCAMRIIGIGYISGICYDASLDMGARGLASAVMTIGRIQMLLIVAPYVSEVIGLAAELI